MVLYGDDRKIPVAKTLDRSVVEVDMRHLDIGREGVGINGVAVVLRRDLDAAGRQVLHGLVAAVVAEFQLEGSPPSPDAQDLMPQADAEERHAAPEFPHRINRIRR